MPEDLPQPELRSPAKTNSVKETIESVIIAFVLAFVFRAFIVEAFVIPTGSMAPTLLGAHVRVVCPECGYEFAVGPRDVARNNRRQAKGFQGVGSPLELRCPMTGQPFEVRNVRTNPGDRILVLKYIYRFTDPQRWDVVVFKNPEDPRDNYIKRLIGLAGEQLWLVRGNVYTRPLTGSDIGEASEGPGEPWRIQRKTAKAQAAMWQPVYHSRYVPAQPESDGFEWESPWQAVTASNAVVGEIGEGSWSALDGGRSFRWEPAHEGEDAGVLAFSFDDVTATDYYAYNMTPPGQTKPRVPFTIEDLRVAVTVEPETEPDGDEVVWLSLTTANPGGDDFSKRLSRAMLSESEREAAAARVAPPLREWRVVIDGRGAIRLMVRQRGGAGEIVPGFKTEVGTAQMDWPRAEKGARVELSHADQRVEVRVNGELKIRHDYEDQLTTAELLSRREVMQRPEVRVGVVGGAMQLHRLNVDRDLYYTPGRDEGGLGVSEPMRLGEDEFYCLGDNSPQSKDSRLWEYVNPWVSFYEGSAGQDVPLGVVPRDLLLGRAFFVYWPAPYRFSPTGWGIIPNFGDMRSIR